MKIGVDRTLALFAFLIVLAGSTVVGTRSVEGHSTTRAASENAPRTGSKQTMSQSISTLLTRNLQDVFGENDANRRRAAIDEIYTEDIVFYETNKNVYRGRDEIDRVAGALTSTSNRTRKWGNVQCQFDIVFFSFSVFWLPLPLKCRIGAKPCHGPHTPIWNG